MYDMDPLVLDSSVSGSLRETLVLRGSVGPSNLIVLFSVEILEHWPREIQAERLNEMLPFIEGAVRRSLAGRRYSVVDATLTGSGDAYLVVLGWRDIAN